MVKDADDKLLDEILANGGSQYFFHKLENGLVEVVFKTGIRQIKPGEEDSAGRIWTPKLTDANGNPVLDKKGNPREPWIKFEAEVTIKGVPYVYSFSGANSSIFRNFVTALRNEGMSNNDLPGTKWAIERIGQWDWRIRFLGKEEQSSVPVKPVNPDIAKIKQALAIKKDLAPNGISRGDLLTFLAVATHRKPDELKALIPELIETRIIKEENNLIYIL